MNANYFPCKTFRGIGAVLPCESVWYCPEVCIQHGIISNLPRWGEFPVVVGYNGVQHRLEHSLKFGELILIGSVVQPGVGYLGHSAIFCVHIDHIVAGAAITPGHGAVHAHIVIGFLFIHPAGAIQLGKLNRVFTHAHHFAFQK